MGALIYKIGSFKMRSWEIISKITQIFFKENYLKMRLQEKGNSILRIIPYRAFVLRKDLLPNFLRAMPMPTQYLKPISIKYASIRFFTSASETLDKEENKDKLIIKYSILEMSGKDIWKELDNYAGILIADAAFKTLTKNKNSDLHTSYLMLLLKNSTKTVTFMEKLSENWKQQEKEEIIEHVKKAKVQFKVSTDIYERLNRS